MPQISMWDYSDLVNEGVLYCFKCQKSFDESLGVPFDYYFNRALFFCYTGILGKEMMRIKTRRAMPVDFDRPNPRRYNTRTPFIRDFFVEQLTANAQIVVETLLSSYASDILSRPNPDSRPEVDRLSEVIGVTVKEYKKAVREIKEKLLSKEE